jgi:long-chain acyl-CoA synthetase
VTTDETTTPAGTVKRAPEDADTLGLVNGPSAPQTIAEYVQQALDTQSDHLCLVNPDGAAWTYRQAAGATARLHEVFRRIGLRPGDRLVLLGPNSAQWCLVYLAALTSGVVIVPILPDFPRSSVHNIILMSGARAAFVSASLIDRLQGATFPELRHAIVLEDFTEVAVTRIGDLLAQVRAQVEHLRDQAQRLIAERLNVGAPVARPEPGDLAAIVYTSGTTGGSKGVMLSQTNLVADVLAAIRYVEISPADRMLSLLPLAHTYESTCGFLGPFGGGASFHFLGQRPAPKVLLEAFARVKPTLVFAVPLVIEKIYRRKVHPAMHANALLRALVRLPAGRRAACRKAVRGLLAAFGGALRQMGFGGAPLPREVERFLRDGAFPYFVGYGMTECAPLITGCRPEETRLGSCGYPVDGIELRIADPDPATGVGEVHVRGPMVTSGYFRNPEATRELFTRDGWLRTGDLGCLDRDGFLYLKGRSKNMFLRPSGENIYPEEIEQLLAASPFVAECLVVQREHRLEALLVPEYDSLREELHLGGGDESEVARRIDGAFAALVREVNVQLPPFSQLARFELRETEFEKTPTSKVKRYLYT